MTKIELINEIANNYLKMNLKSIAQQICIWAGQDLGALTLEDILKAFSADMTSCADDIEFMSGAILASCSCDLEHKSPHGQEAVEILSIGFIAAMLLATANKTKNIWGDFDYAVYYLANLVSYSHKENIIDAAYWNELLRFCYSK